MSEPIIRHHLLVGHRFWPKMDGSFWFVIWPLLNIKFWWVPCLSNSSSQFWQRVRVQSWTVDGSYSTSPTFWHVSPDCFYLTNWGHFKSNSLNPSQPWHLESGSLPECRTILNLSLKTWDTLWLIFSASVLPGFEGARHPNATIKTVFPPFSGKDNAAFDLKL